MRSNYGTALIRLFFSAAILSGSFLPAREKDTLNVIAKQINAIKTGGHHMQIDGRLDEAPWREAPAASEFRQRQPAEGEPASERTEVRFLYDDEALYIGARMFCPHPEKIISLTTRRDVASNSERIIISLDTYRDRRTAYTFAVTASGVRVEYYHPRDEEFARDFSFDPVWEARTRIDSAGWTAEMRIPFSQLRFNNQEQQVWGVNINRWIPDINEDVYWIYVPSKETGWSSRFGTLEGIRDIRPSRRLELLPYAAAGLTLDSQVSDSDPFRNQTDLNHRAGLDLKMGLGPNLTLDATVNPDFGQVEADPAEVNLSAFETFFDERRPFFTEGDQLLQGSGPGYYYSRRIGASPHKEVEGDYVDVPNNSTIIGAAKLTGRLKSGLSLGALTALTAREYARSYDRAADVQERIQVEPASGFGVLRLQQEFGREASTVGLTLTGVQRDLTSGEPLAAELNRRALSGGSDWNLRFKNGMYQLGGHLGFSHVEGDAGAIAAVQRASARYYQRPDIDYLTLDTTRTSLGGYSAGLYLSKNSGKHWLWGSSFWAESPGFELNDVGRLNSSDDAGLQVYLRYRETLPTRYFQNYQFEISSAGEWNYGGERQLSVAELAAELMLRNFWRIKGEFGYSTRAQSDKLTRGGPSMGSGRGWWGEAGLSNSFAATTRWELGLYTSRTELGSREVSARGQLSFRPGSRWELSLAPRFYRHISVRQYVTEAAGGRAETYGRRYIFATVDQRILSSQLRLNYAFTPDFSLEFYGEPFSARGTFYNFGELAAARSRDLRYYGSDGSTIQLDPAEDRYEITDGGQQFGFDDPDFFRLSFRSNLVLRWEWRPGSTLFLVWQQNRGEDRESGDGFGAGNLLDSFASAGNHFFALKLSYWLPVD